MNIKYPDYNNCITNLACSILKEFGVEKESKQGLVACEEIFREQYKNVVVLLLDGMGTSIIEKNLSKDGFFAKHLITTYSSVFPPTTVAATTSIDSGKEPVEHSWLGWECYYKEIDKNVTVFLNTEAGTQEAAADFPVAYTYCGYESVVQQIIEKGGKAYYATPFVEPYPDNFEAICDRVENLCQKEGKKYIYAYWNEPDFTMHKKGCHHEESVRLLQNLEKRVEKLCENLQDTLVIVTADHGHIDAESVAIEEYPEIMECLVRLPSIEPRALSLFVKEGLEKQFETVFHQAFGEKFLLLTKEQVKEKKLFGLGVEHPQFDSMLGDYLAVAIDNLAIFNTREEKEKFIGVHAGLTEEEMNIPLIAIKRAAKYPMLHETVTVTVDRKMGTYHPKHPDIFYPINYGYIEGIMAGDGEEQDAYIIGVDVPVDTFTGTVAAIIHRKDDVEEKWVVCPAGMKFAKEEIVEQVKFQEQYFDSYVIT